MKLGIYGGSFNPVHYGHVELAKNAVAELKLDKLLIMPARKPPHKPNAVLAPDSDRFNMCRLAFGAIPAVEVSDYELRSEDEGYTLLTVKALRRIYQADEIFLLVGSDMLLYFEQWYCWQELLSLVTLAVYSRENDDHDALSVEAERLSKFGKIFLSSHKPLPLSSTYVRELIKNKENLTCSMPHEVVEYIVRRGLYN